MTISLAFLAPNLVKAAVDETGGAGDLEVIQQDAPGCRSKILQALSRHGTA